jgi:hypothetical protein
VEASPYPRDVGANWQLRGQVRLCASYAHATPGLALGLAAALLLGNGLGWRIASATFDRERLITTTK